MFFIVILLLSRRFPLFQIKEIVIDEKIPAYPTLVMQYRP